MSNSLPPQPQPYVSYILVFIQIRGLKAYQNVLNLPNSISLILLLVVSSFGVAIFTAIIDFILGVLATVIGTVIAMLIYDWIKSH